MNRLLHVGTRMMGHGKNMLGRKGQNLLEYAIVISIIASAVVAMSTYVFRSVQATQQEIQKGFRN